MQGYRSGLEASAEDGEGYGIEKFKPQRGPLQISKNLKIPNLARVIQRMGENARDFVLPVASPTDQERPLRLWTADESQTAEAIGFLDPPPPLPSFPHITHPTHHSPVSR